MRSLRRYPDPDFPGEVRIRLYFPEDIY